MSPSFLLSSASDLRKDHLEPPDDHDETASFRSISSYASKRSSTTTTTTTAPPPPYSEAIATSSSSSSGATATAFTPTHHLQIQTPGVTSCSSLNCNDPIPIPVYRVDPSSSSSSSSLSTPEYISLRLKPSSNSCALVRGSDSHQTPLNSTIYRWGPGRHPRIRLFSSSSSSCCTVEQAIQSDPKDLSLGDNDIIDVKSRSVFSRTQRMVTPFGRFQWRYGDRSERKEENGGWGANNLLVLEREVDGFDDEGEKEKRGKDGKYRRVALFVRNDEFRTPGTSKWMAGNGGRLMMDLSLWDGDEKGVEKGRVEPFIVAGCICMLKREVDRMRDNTIAAVS